MTAPLSGSFLRRLIGVAALLTSALALPAFAAVPTLIQVEGALRSVGGGAVSDGSYKVTFALYKDALGGTPVWSEKGVVLGVQGGTFSYLLGSTEPIKQDTLAGLPQVWFSVTVEGDPELPRRPLASVPFSLRAGLAEGLD